MLYSWLNVFFFVRMVFFWFQFITFALKYNNMKLSSIIHTNWLATFRLNYHAGGWKAVRRLPIRVYGPLKFSLEGRLILPRDIRKNMIVINADHEDYTASSGKAELNIQGTWKLGGGLHIGPDCCIAVADGAFLETGADTYVGRDTQIHCYHHVSIGNGVFAGEMYVCDSAIHQLFYDGVEKTMHGQVVIGNGVYLGFRTMLLKGTVIPARSVVGSGAICVSDYSKSGTEKLFICGNPAIVKAQDVTAKF